MFLFRTCSVSFFYTEIMIIKKNFYALIFLKTSVLKEGFKNFAFTENRKFGRGFENAVSGTSKTRVLWRFRKTVVFYSFNPRSCIFVCELFDRSAVKLVSIPSLRERKGSMFFFFFFKMLF